MPSKKYKPSPSSRNSLVTILMKFKDMADEAIESGADKKIVDKIVKIKSMCYELDDEFDKFSQYE